MKVKDNVKMYTLEEGVIMNSYETKQNEAKKTGTIKSSKGYRVKNIACINSFISYFMKQDKKNLK